jgi:hypothetical protein
MVGTSICDSGLLVSISMPGVREHACNIKTGNRAVDLNRDLNMDVGFLNRHFC